MKKLILITFATAAIVIAAQAQNQTIIAVHGQQLVLTGTQGSGSVAFRYEWRRNGTVISTCDGPTHQNCTVPGNLANGQHQVFTRRIVLTEQCLGPIEQESNSVTVHFKCGGGHGTVVTNTSTGTELCWADYNSGEGGRFVGTLATNTTLGRGDVYTPFFQWNRMAAWPATGAVTGWDGLSDPAMEAAVTWDPQPCPAGWRLPTQAEFTALTVAGRLWQEANVRGNSVGGMFFGHGAATCGFNTGQNMFGCIFLPAVGYRRAADGTLESALYYSPGTGGLYWMSAHANAASGRYFIFNVTGARADLTLDKVAGMSIRCVQ